MRGLIKLYCLIIYTLVSSVTFALAQDKAIAVRECGADGPTAELRPGASTATTIIRSFNMTSGHYRNSEDCQIQFWADTQPLALSLTFNVFDVEADPECRRDYLCINGVHFCGSWQVNKTFTFKVPAHRSFTLRFVTDATVSGRGFEITAVVKVTDEHAQFPEAARGYDSAEEHLVRTVSKKSSYRDRCLKGNDRLRPGDPFTSIKSYATTTEGPDTTDSDYQLEYASDKANTYPLLTDYHGYDTTRNLFLPGSHLSESTPNLFQTDNPIYNTPISHRTGNHNYDNTPNPLHKDNPVYDTTHNPLQKDNPVYDATHNPLQKDNPVYDATHNPLLTDNTNYDTTHNPLHQGSDIYDNTPRPLHTNNSTNNTTLNPLQKDSINYDTAPNPLQKDNPKDATFNPLETDYPSHDPTPHPLQTDRPSYETPQNSHTTDNPEYETTRNRHTSDYPFIDNTHDPLHINHLEKDTTHNPLETTHLNNNMTSNPHETHYPRHDISSDPQRTDYIDNSAMDSVDGNYQPMSNESVNGVLRTTVTLETQTPIITCNSHIQPVSVNSASAASYIVRNAGFGTRPYRNNEQCSVEFRTSSTARLFTVKFNALDLESHYLCSYDSICVGGVRFCDSSETGHAYSYVVPAHQTFTLAFITDVSNTGSGFQVEVDIQDTIRSSGRYEESADYSPSLDSVSRQLRTTDNYVDECSFAPAHQPVVTSKSDATVDHYQSTAQGSVTMEGGSTTTDRHQITDYDVHTRQSGYQSTDKGYQTTDNSYETADKGYQTADKGYHTTNKDYQTTNKGYYQTTTTSYQTADKSYQTTNKGYYHTTNKDYHTTNKDYQTTNKGYYQTTTTSYQTADKSYQTTDNDYKTTGNGHQSTVNGYQSSESVYQTTNSDYQTKDKAYPTSDKSYQTSGNGYETTDNAYPTTDNAYPTTDNAYPTTDNAYPTTEKSYQTSDNGYETTNSAYPTTDNAHQTTDSRYETTNSDYQTKYKAYPTTDKSYQTSDNGYETTDNAYPTTDNAYPTTDNAYPTTEKSYQTSDNGYETTNSAYPTTDNAHQTTDSRYETTNSDYQTKYKAYPTTDKSYQTSDNGYETTDNAYPTTDNAYPTTDNAYPTTDSRYQITDSRYQTTNPGIQRTDNSDDAVDTDFQTTDNIDDRQGNISVPTRNPWVRNSTIYCGDHPTTVNVSHEKSWYIVKSGRQGDGTRYTNNERCLVVYGTPNVSKMFTVTFKTFDLEYHKDCCYDSLCMKGVKYCGDWAAGHSFRYVVSAFSTFTIAFSTDESKTGRGFEIQITISDPPADEEVTEVFTGVGSRAESLTYKPSNTSDYTDKCQQPVTCASGHRPPAITATPPSTTTTESSTNWPAPSADSGFLAQHLHVILRMIEAAQERISYAYDLLAALV